MGYGERDKTRWVSSWTNSVCLALQISLGSEDPPPEQVCMAAAGKSPGKSDMIYEKYTKFCAHGPIWLGIRPSSQFNSLNVSTMDVWIFDERRGKIQSFERVLLRLEPVSLVSNSGK